MSGPSLQHSDYVAAEGLTCADHVMTCIGSGVAASVTLPVFALTRKAMPHTDTCAHACFLFATLALGYITKELATMQLHFGSLRLHTQLSL